MVGDHHGEAVLDSVYTAKSAANCFPHGRKGVVSGQGRSKKSEKGKRRKRKEAKGEGKRRRGL